MSDRLIDFLFRHRVFVLGWLVAITLVLGAAARDLKTDFDIEQFLPSDDDGRRYFESFKSAFDVTDRDIMVLWTDERLFSAESLAAIRDLTRDLERVKGIEEVVSITNADDVRGTEDSLEVHPMLAEIPADQAGRDAIREQILANSLYRERILARDGQSTCLLAKVDWGHHAGSLHRGSDVHGSRLATAGIGDAATERARICAEVERLAERYAAPGRIFRFGGVPFVRRDYVDLIVGDAQVFFPLALLLGTVILALVFRNVSGVALTLGVMVGAVTWTLGLMALTGCRLNFLSNMMPTLVMIAGTSDSMHIVLHYYEEYARVRDKMTALRRTVKELSFACFLTSFTTALGFLTLITSKITLIEEFGVFTGLGILFAFVISILAIPIVLSWLPPPTERAQRSFEVGFLAGMLRALPVWVAARRRTLLVGLGAMLLVSGWSWMQLECEGRMLEDLRESHKIIRTNRFVEANFGGILALELVIDSGAEDGVKDPGFLRRLRAFQDFLATVPNIRKVLSIADFVEDLHESFRGEDPAFRHIPDTREEVAQLLLLYSFSNKEPLKGFLSYDYRRARISAKIRDCGTQATLAAVTAVRSYYAEHFAGMAPLRMTGLAYLGQEVNNYIVSDMSTSFMLDLLIICVLFYAITGTVKLMIAGLVPNLAPLGATIIVMAVSGIALKPSTAIIFSIVFGIAVDDSLHFLARFREEWARTPDTMTAVARTFVGTGRATVFFSVMLTLGFSILLFSSFVGNQLFALLSGVTIMAGLAGELLLMPLCLLVLGPTRRDARNAESETVRT